MQGKFDIVATYERIAYQKTEDPEAVTYHDHSLRIDGTGDIPKDTEKLLLHVVSQGEGIGHKILVPEEFSRLGYFIIMATDLPFEIEYGKSAMVSIVKSEGGDILARTMLKYRTA